MTPLPILIARVRREHPANPTAMALCDSADLLLGWRDAASAPCNGDDFIGCLWGNTIIVLCYDGDPKDPLFPWATLDGPSYHRDALTHWMPLPNLPKKEENIVNGDCFEYRSPHPVPVEYEE